MARLPRIVLAGAPHHVVQQGHNRQAIVTDDEDRRTWLGMLREAALTLGVAVHAWALLEDRFHLIATPASPEALSRLMQTLGRRYVGWFNRRHARSGTLWDGRFRASALEPARWLLPCMRYVESQAAPAGAPTEPVAPMASSLAHHLGQRTDPLVTDHPVYWGLGNTPFERQAAYRRLADAGLDEDVVVAIAAATHRGWPLGTPAFIAEAQAESVQPLVPRSRGRPRKRLLT